MEIAMGFLHSAIDKATPMQLALCKAKQNSATNRSIPSKVLFSDVLTVVVIDKRVGCGETVFLQNIRISKFVNEK